MIFALIIFISLLIFLFVEGYGLKRSVSCVKTRILINGTRGKTSLASLLHSSLIHSGIKCLSRTTGSEMRYLFPDGRIEKKERGRRFSHLDVKNLMHLARKLDVDCVILECNALDIDSQKAFRDILFKPTHVVITNTFIDHIPEMGKGKKEISSVLSSSVPSSSTLYVSEPFYSSHKGRIVNIKKCFYERIRGIHPDVLDCALTVLKDLGYCEESFYKGLDAFIPDIGLLESTNVGRGSVFIPSFSVNDLESMESLLLDNFREDKALVAVFSSRSDREYRILIFEEILKRKKVRIDRVFVLGDYPKKSIRHFSPYVITEHVEVDSLSRIILSSENTIFVGLGNIKGDGESLIREIHGGGKCFTAIRH